MNIPEYLFKFPQYLPNDLEAFMIFYPRKFPQIVPYFEEVAKKIGADPKGYQEYGDWAREELFTGFEKIKKDYEAGDQTNLEFLVSIDQRFHKLICFRFWVINYLFADGPLHDFYVDTLKNMIRKFVDVTEEIEDYEERVMRIQRDLLQSDYADLYLTQALHGVEFVKLLQEDEQLNAFLDQAIPLIDQHNLEKAPEINAIWDKVVAAIKNDEQKYKELKDTLALPLHQAEMRHSMLPVYNMITHAVEFRNENLELQERYHSMQSKIDDLMNQAKGKLSDDEFEMFELSYKMCRNFSMYKDIMGEIDGYLLPVWFGLHDKVRQIVAPNYTLPRTGHSSMFYQLVWYLPMEMKNKVYSIDPTEFRLEDA